jgi:hypothetical protein
MLQPSTVIKIWDSHTKDANTRFWKPHSSGKTLFHLSQVSKYTETLQPSWFERVVPPVRIRTVAGLLLGGRTAVRYLCYGSISSPNLLHKTVTSFQQNSSSDLGPEQHSLCYPHNPYHSYGLLVA